MLQGKKIMMNDIDHTIRPNAVKGTRGDRLGLQALRGDATAPQMRYRVHHISEARLDELQPNLIIFFYFFSKQQQPPFVSLIFISSYLFLFIFSCFCCYFFVFPCLIIFQFHFSVFFSSQSCFS